METATDLPFPKQHDTPDMRLASLLQETREALGLTRKKLSKMTGIPEKTIERYETGFQSPTVERLKALGHVLKLSPAQIFDEIELPEDMPLSRRIATPSSPAEELQAQVRELQRKIDQLTGSQDDGSDDDSEENPVVGALGNLSRAAAKGIASRALPVALNKAQPEVRALEYGELHRLALQRGLDLTGFPTPKEFGDLGPKKRLQAEEQVEAFVLADSVYGQQWRDLQKEHLEQAMDIAREQLGPDAKVYNRAIFGESLDEYLLRLRREVTPFLIRCIVEAEAIDLGALQEGAR